MKGFVGPIGDDLPSLIAIMLALTLFFAGLTFAMRTFNRKQRDVTLMKGSLDVSRAIIQEPVLEQGIDLTEDSTEAKSIARNNQLAFNAKFKGEDFGDAFVPGGNNVDDCGEDALYFSFLVAREEGDDKSAMLAPVSVCVWEPN